MKFKVLVTFCALSSFTFLFSQNDSLGDSKKRISLSDYFTVGMSSENIFSFSNIHFLDNLDLYESQKQVRLYVEIGYSKFFLRLKFINADQIYFNSNLYNFSSLNNLNKGVRSEDAFSGIGLGYYVLNYRRLSLVAVADFSSDKYTSFEDEPDIRFKHTEFGISTQVRYSFFTVDYDDNSSKVPLGQIGIVFTMRLGYSNTYEFLDINYPNWYFQPSFGIYCTGFLNWGRKRLGTKSIDPSKNQ